MCTWIFRWVSVTKIIKHGRLIKKKIDISVVVKFKQQLNKMKVK